MKPRSLWLLPLLAALASLAAPPPAIGFTADSASPYEIAMPLPPRYAPAQVEIRDAAQDAARGARDALGGNWRVASWSPLSGTASYLVGSGAAVASPLASAFDAGDAARRTIADHPGLFRADPDELRLLDTVQGMGKWSAHFQQTYRGLDVWGGGAHLTFTEAGRLFALGSTCYAGIDVATTPNLSAAAAERIAAGDLPYYPPADFIEAGTTLLVLPVPRSDTQADFHLVWRVRVRTSDPLGIWVTHVDAHSGAILWRYNDIHFANFTGNAVHDVEPATYCNPIEEQAQKYVRVQIAGVGETTTDQAGGWTIPYAGNDPRTVTCDLYGPYIRVFNQSGAEAQYSGTATPGVPHTVFFDDGNAQRDERDAFDAVNDIHDFISLFDPTFGYINQRITCNVSLNSTCNAYWDGTINFYREGGGCANTGQIQGVVHHEFGHGIQYSILGSQGNEGLGEGNSDIMANLMTQESIIGRGFYLNQCSGGIRNSDNTLWYPEDMNGSIHHDGQIIAGFHWDFMELLQAAYGDETGRVMAGERWHFGRRLERPFFQPDQVIATAIADDDDGNLDNGTPHYDMIWEAAENHGFHRYIPEIVDIAFVHTPLTTTTEGGDAEVVATIYSTHGVPLESSSILLNVRRDPQPGDPFAPVAMLPTGNQDEYHAFIGGLRVPTEVEYYLSAADALGYEGTAPRSAPANVYAFDVANILDPLEDESGWGVNLEGGDNATTGVWVRADPVGTGAQPEDDHTLDGSICWVTGNANPGDPIGTNDIDGGTTTVYSPAFDVTDAETAKVKFWRWYSNSQGADPNNDTWVVQVRNNGGAWQDVERNQDDQNQWIYRQVDLVGIFGAALGTVQLKFVASDLNSGSIVEAAVDDLVVLMSSGFSAAGDGIAGTARFALHGSRANPVPGATEISFQVPVSTAVELTVFDISGRAVSNLAGGRFAPGVHTVAWDGRDSGGRALASGVYYVRMQTPGFQATRTLVLSR